MRRRDLLPAALLCAPVLQGQSAPPPSRRITVGLIGCGNQGINDLKLFLVTDSVDEAVDQIRQAIPKYGLKHIERKPSWLLGEHR